MNTSRPGQWLTLAALLALAAVLVPLNEGRWSLSEDPLRHALALAATLSFAFAWRIGARSRARRRAPPQALPEAPSDQPAPDFLPIFHATQTGEAEALAHRARDALRSGGVAAQVFALETLEPAALAALPRALFIASTTGEGDPPDAVAAFAGRTLGATLPLASLRYGVLALGDRSYEDFCGFGRRLDEWLASQGARPLFPRIEVDDGDPAALDAFHRALAEAVAGVPLPAPWREAPFQAWRIARRVHLNPGSQGEAAFLLELSPMSGLMPQWRAGDLAEILPGHAPEALARWFEATSLDPDTAVSGADGMERLGLRLACSELPDPADVAGLTAQAVSDRLVPLRPRDYSIASLPSDGHLALLVRESRRPDGRLGLASGWLCRHAPERARISLRLRANPGFHAPDDDLPLILIGNGTGIAGLRALLRERIAQGRFDTWLAFGERQRARDFFFGPELEAARDAGRLAHLSLAFSRDGGQARYVQHLLEERAERLRDWIARGAHLRVCGSLEGMAGGVDEVLRRILGAAAVDTLLESRRYRRDVY